MAILRARVEVEKKKRKEKKTRKRRWEANNTRDTRWKECGKIHLHGPTVETRRRLRNNGCCCKRFPRSEQVVPRGGDHSCELKFPWSAGNWQLMILFRRPAYQVCLEIFISAISRGRVMRFSCTLAIIQPCLSSLRFYYPLHDIWAGGYNWDCVTVNYTRLGYKRDFILRGCFDNYLLQCSDSFFSSFFFLPYSSVNYLRQLRDGVLVSISTDWNRRLGAMILFFISTVCSG